MSLTDPTAAADALRAEAQPFELTGPLPRGVTVLEASAGTGKTYTIAALATRFIAEGAATLDQLLMVTFTRLATSELRERVRERLVGTEAALTRILARAALTGSDATTSADGAGEDDVIARLLADASGPVVRERQARLADAIANFDAATIETTHGFCQRALDSLGTLAETEPSVTFVENVDELVTEVIDDLYLRRFFRDRGDGLMLTREQAGQIARTAIRNPLTPVYPLDPPAGSAQAMRRGLARAARDELERRKRTLGLMTHDDQLTRLLHTLAGDRGEEAVAMLRDRFSVVLIDEFQDTDPIQWQIVRRAFGDGRTTLVLIGDPKQAIYAFRGADVYAYLQAARSAGALSTLAVNRRSDQALLDGLDALFGNAWLGHREIVYRQVCAAPAHDTPRLHGAPSQAALRCRLLDVNEPAIQRTGGGYPTKPSATAFVARDVAADIVALLDSGAEIDARADDGERLGTRGIAPGDIAVLVRSHRQADMVAAELTALGVPAVINGSGSVFATPAAGDWLKLLTALEQPSRETLARTAALTPLLGWSATQLATASDAELELLHRRLHAWARTLRDGGFATLAESVLASGQASTRLLALAGGERRLTDLRHVAQLLHGAASAEHLGASALTGWLRERVAESESDPGGDERTRRLDSDAAAVQVLTIHSSKGLEFPVVYCPFAWDALRPREDPRPLQFHDGDTRAIDVSLEGPGFAAHAEQQLREERGEDLRLLYVALTRARHQAVIWWASTYYACESPLGRLLFAQDPSGEVAWKGGRRPREDQALARFAQVAAAAPHAVAVEPARIAATGQLAHGDHAEVELGLARFERRLDTAWRRTSYSALTAAAHEAFVGSEPEHETIADEPDAPSEAVASALPLSEMASGPRLGSLIHAALQAVDFAAADLPAALDAWLAATTAHRPELLGCPPARAAQGLALALATPLGGELGTLTLAGTPRADRLDELEFELPLAGGDTPVAAPSRLADIAALLERHLPADDPVAGYVQRLADPALAATLEGYLTGSIDLVLRMRDPAGGRDRYAIVDYKTNWLGPAGEPLSAAHYRAELLAAEMQRTHYVLQALLYSAALHRYLRWRLAGYDPATDLAGVRYLFLRGMLGTESAGWPASGGPAVAGLVAGAPASGVFAWHPPAALVVELSDLLAGAQR